MPSDVPNKPHGTPTPASTISRVLNDAGYGRAIIRKGEALGGHRCSWDKLQKLVTVAYQCRDITPDAEMAAERAEMLDLYEQVLIGKGYPVRRTGWALHIDMTKEGT